MAALDNGLVAKIRLLQLFIYLCFYSLSRAKSAKGITRRVREGESERNSTPTESEGVRQGEGEIEEQP